MPEMRCNHCGFGVPQEVDKCPNCGTALPHDQGSDTPKWFLVFFVLAVVFSLVMILVLPG